MDLYKYPCEHQLSAPVFERFGYDLLCTDTNAGWSEMDKLYCLSMKFQMSLKSANVHRQFPNYAGDVAPLWVLYVHDIPKWKETT